MLVTAKKILQNAQKRGYAVGAFNINNLEIMQAIVNAGVKLKSPLIIQTTEGAIDYAGMDYLVCMVKTAAKLNKIPIALHLDHGKDLKVIKKAIDSGYTSVMIDGSSLPFKENIAKTKKVVSWARKKGVSVEAEIGVLAGVEDKVSAEKSIYTEPKQAEEFYKKTKVDSLAIAIGTSHGAYKFEGESRLKIDVLREIRKKVKCPLVLHGASGIPEDIVRLAEQYGAKLGHAKGVSERMIKLAVKNGICKVNIDSDLRLSFDAAVRKVLEEKPEIFDPRKILGPARDLITEIVKRKILLFGSNNKASLK